MSDVRYTPPAKEMIDRAFAHYRSTGFPYIKLTDSEIISEFNSLQFCAEPLVENCWQANSTGVSIANLFHPHRYEIQCGEKRTAMYIFGRDHLLKKCLEKTVKMGGEISDSKLRSMIAIFEGVQVPSNFPPATAKAIYEHFLPNGGKVWDMSCGFGGRLLAAMSTPAVSQYFGTDPSTKTYAGLLEMILKMELLFPELKHSFKTEILNAGSETPLPSHWYGVGHQMRGDFDLCFTSPPYFDTEKYARELSQSFLAYPYQDEWINKFVGNTMRNCLSILNPKGHVVVNIANVKTFQNLEKKFIQKSEEIGLKLVDTKFLLYTAMPGQGNKNRQKDFTAAKTKMRSEPIFVFKPR